MFKKQDDSQELKLEDYQPYTTRDYLDHTKEFKKFYLNSNDIKQIQLNTSLKLYLNELAGKIIRKNELFFTRLKKVDFYVVDHPIPFYFSTPDESIFLSSSLVTKYIKNEDILLCIISHELVRIEKGIYYKHLIVPTGVMSLSRLLTIMRLSFKEKLELDKWSYYLTKRIKVREDAYLSWIQIQNRNSNDFQFQSGDATSISREEMYFKGFLIKLGVGQFKNTEEIHSSKDFYQFINFIKRDSKYETRSS